jgi:hypothetical protein
VWQAVWTPAAYEPATLLFVSFGDSHPFLIHTGIMLLLGTDPVTGHPIYGGSHVPDTQGSMQIPMVPAPATLVLLGVECAVSGPATPLKCR